MFLRSILLPARTTEPLTARHSLVWCLTTTAISLVGLRSLFLQFLYLAQPGMPFEDPWFVLPVAIGLGTTVGILVALVVRSVWNRRARQHQLGNTRYTLWPAGRPYLFLLGALLTPIALFYAVENWRGARAWTDLSIKLKSKGEHLDIGSITPPQVPDDQNFANTPLFKLAFTLVPRTDLAPHEFGRFTINTNREARAAWERLRALGVPDPKAPDNKNLSQHAGRQPNGRLDLAAYAKSMRNSTNYHLNPSPVSPSAVLLAGFQENESDLAELSAAAGRPRARFASHPEDLYAALLPHLASVKNLSQTFMLRSTARNQEKEIEGAFADLRTVFRLGETLREEGYLITQLVRIAVHQNTLRTFAEGQAEHSWTEPQLAEFQRLQEALQFRQGLLLALRTERTAAILTVDACRLNPGSLTKWGGPESGSQSDTELLLSAAPFLMPSGWYYRNMAWMGVRFQKVLDEVSASPARFSPNLGKEFVLGLEQVRSYNFLAKLFLPAMTQAFTKFNRAETTRQLAVVVCALERYRLRHHSYPENLSDLAPEFVAAPPLDFMDDQPLRYRRTDDGWFQLYSVGANGIDDHGLLRKVSDQTNEELDWAWPSPVGDGARLF